MFMGSVFQIFSKWLMLLVQEKAITDQYYQYTITICKLLELSYSANFIVMNFIWVSSRTIRSLINNRWNFSLSALFSLSEAENSTK